MGVCMSLVSDSSKSWFDLGKVFLPETAVERIRAAEGADLEGTVSAWLQDDEYNRPFPEAEAREAATAIAAWVRAHPDWRFLSDQDEEFEDVYLAEDDEDANDYVEDGGENCAPIYKKDGSIGAGGEDKCEGGFTLGLDAAVGMLGPEAQEVVREAFKKPFGPPILGRAFPKLPPLDEVYLPFSVVLAPGERREVRPDKAIRVRGGVYKEVLLDSIKPFRTRSIGPVDAAGCWSPESGIWFLAVHLDGTRKSDLISEASASLVMHGRTFSTSPSAANVWFVVENRGNEGVKFSGVVEGSTLSEEAQ